MSNYQTVAEHNNAEAFRGEWQYDEVTKAVVRDLQMAFIISTRGVELPDRVGEQVAVFCHNAHRLYIVPHQPPARPPRLFLTIHERELEASPADTIITVEVTRGDGKSARVHLTLGKSDLHGLFASMNAPSRNVDHTNVRKLHFADWSSQRSPDAP